MGLITTIFKRFGHKKKPHTNSKGSNCFQNVGEKNIEWSSHERWSRRQRHHNVSLGLGIWQQHWTRIEDGLQLEVLM